MHSQDQPPLIEPRSELSGTNSVMFAVLVIVALVASLYLLANFVRIGPTPATPTPAETLAAVAASPSFRPSLAATAEPTEEVPIGTLLPSEPLFNSPGEPVNVVVGGNVVGTVTVKSIHWPTSVKGTNPPRGTQWLAIDLAYDASEGDISYSTGDWTLVDEQRNVVVPATVQKPPELGSGTLTSGNEKEAWVTFLVPTDQQVVLRFTNGDTQADYRVKPQ
jgi:hypothetical protein